ncbi:MAG TPA: type II secretion system F family protein [Acidimicrobiales bacterium]|nr:type II secretion system F family protein [Acidimicrobiales bacterium]
MPLIPLLGAVAVISALPLLWWAVSGSRTSPAAARNLQAGRAAFTDFHQAVLSHSVQERAVGPAVERLARRARRLTPNGMFEGLERRVLLAGVPEAWPMERVLATKLLLGGLGAALSIFWFIDSPGFSRLLIGSVGTAFAWFVPDILLYNAAEKRQLAIKRALPDTLDQMTIAVEAGLAFEAAMARAGRSGSGCLNEELQRTMQDVQVGLSRSEALRSLMERTDVEELRHFVLAVIQSESYGVPISRVLRIQASELRIKRRQQAEEKAMKLPVKILFPLLFCIFPTIFLVLLGPAAIRLTETLSL